MDLPLRKVVVKLAREAKREHPNNVNLPEILDTANKLAEETWIDKMSIIGEMFAMIPEPLLYGGIAMMTGGTGLAGMQLLKKPKGKTSEPPNYS